MIKVFIAPVPHDQLQGAEKNIIRPALRDIESVKRVRAEEDADLIIYTNRSAIFSKNGGVCSHDSSVAYWPRKFTSKKLKLKHPEKTILLDFVDCFSTLIPVDNEPKLYFKRSIINKKESSAYYYEGRNQPLHIPYAVRKDFLEHVDTSIDFKSRKVDVSCFFKLEPSFWGDGQRVSVSRRIFKEKEELNRIGYSVHSGVVGKNRKTGRNIFQEEYFNACKNTKIIVHCNPDMWEGDFRLYESLASGALVFCDRLLSMEKHCFPLIDKKHLIYYDPNNLDELMSMIKYYLENQSEAERIAYAGQQEALENHTYKARMQQVIDEFQRISKKEPPNR